MVDTPRTLAEVLALLADNSTGDIAPQDVRDAIVSITDPIIGGGFPPVVDLEADFFSLVRDETGATMLSGVYGFFAGSAAPLLPVADAGGNEYYVVELDEHANDTAASYAFDPSGWRRDTAFTTGAFWGGVDLPAKCGLELPAGRYVWNARVIWQYSPSGAPAEGDSMSVYWDYAVDPATLGTFQAGAFTHIAATVPNAALAENSYPSTWAGGKAEGAFAGQIAVAPTASPLLVFPYLIPHLTTDAVIDGFNLQVMRVA